MDLNNEPNFGGVDKKQLFAQLESAVSHLHSLGMAHNDINPRNIMIKDGDPILIDFGSCQPYGKATESRITGVVRGDLLHFGKEPR